MQKIMKKNRVRILALLVIVSVLGLAGFAVAQSSSGGGFNLNSPASFPVDI